MPTTTPPGRSAPRLPFFVLALGVTAPGAGSAQQPAQPPDRIVMTAGVALEGDLESAARGDVTFDSEVFGDVTVDLDDVAELTSGGLFEIKAADGARYLGSLEAGEPGTVVVVGEARSDVLPLSDIVEIVSLSRGFWERTDGHVDIGGSIAQANALSALSVGTRASYRGPRWGVAAGLQGYWQRQEVATGADDVAIDVTHRLAVDGSVTRFLGRWAAVATVLWQRNEELGLDSRIQLAGLAAYDFARTRAVELQGALGIVNNTESYVGAPSSSSGELASGLSLDLFDIGDVDLFSQLFLYRSLEVDRYRASFDGRVSWEVIEDFTIGLTYSEDYDSRPPAVGVVKRDYRYGLTVGWSWS